MIKNFKHWTKEEKDYLHSVWGTSTLKALSKKLNRKPETIYEYAMKNGLGGCVYTGMFLTTVDAANIIKVDPTTILKWIKDGDLPARKSTMKRRWIYKIEPDVFYKFLEENQDRWNSKNLEYGIIGKFDDEPAWLTQKRKNDANLTVKVGELWTLKEILQLEQLVKDGKTSKQIAVIMNRTYSAVRRKREYILTDKWLKIKAEILK